MSHNIFHNAIWRPSKQRKTCVTTSFMCYSNDRISTEIKTTISVKRKINTFYCFHFAKQNNFTTLTGHKKYSGDPAEFFNSVVSCTRQFFALHSATEKETQKVKKKLPK